MNALLSSALGQVPFDLVLTNARYVNVHTEEIYQAEIGITHGRVAHITPPGVTGLTGRRTHDCENRFVVPGLIDTHVHIESSMLTPANFARAAIPHGTTTVLADPHEICNVLGVQGMEFCVNATKSIPLRVYLAAPSCVPSVPGFENNKMAFGPDEITRMLAMPRVIALGEVMDYPGVIRQSPRMMDIITAARKRHVIIQGHVIGVPPRELSAYQAAGVESDHESRTPDEVVQKLRNGMVVECRYGSNAQNVPMEAEVLKQFNFPVNATLCTDDREPHDLLRIGQLDEAVRQAIAHGVPPVKAVQMATRNAALFLGIRDIGSLHPGSHADLLLVDDLEAFSVSAVFIDGVLTARNGQLVREFPDPDSGFENTNTMQVKAGLSRDNFCIPVKGDPTRLNCLSFTNGDPFHTTLVAADFSARDGFADVNGADGYVTMAVVERHNATGNIGIAPARNIGLTRGAVAGTVAHDSHNLFLFGKNPDDMLVAATRLIELGGGFVAVDGGKVLAEVPLPVCGLMSRGSVTSVAEEMHRMKDAVNRLGIPGDAPVHMLTWFCLAVLPEVRLTDMGLVDTVNQKMIPLYA